MLRKKRCALFRPSAGQQFVDSTVNWNEAAWIIMAEIHENHPHTQFAQKFLVKGFQSAVPVKTNQQGVKVQIKADGPDPINALNRFLIAFQRSTHFRQNVGVFRLCRSYRRNFQ
jgi:hypothetical protein